MTFLDHTNSEYTTAQGVSLTLTKANHTRSKKTATRIRGYNTWTAGFETTQAGRGVRISYNHNSENRNPDHNHARATITRIAETLQAKGYTVEPLLINNTLLVYKPRKAA